VGLQLAQYLHADESPWAAAFCAALHVPGASQVAPAAVGSHTRSRGPPPPHLAPEHIRAERLLAEQHADVLAAVTAAHPALADRRRPLLCHKLAALPPLLHNTACDAVVRRGSGHASVGLRNHAKLITALQALASTTALVSLSVGLDWGHDSAEPSPQHETEPAPLVHALGAQPHVTVLTQLTGLAILGVDMDSAEASVDTAAALPTLSSLQLAIAGPPSGSGEISPDRALTFYCGVAQCTALSALTLTGMPEVAGADVDPAIWASCVSHLASLTSLAHVDLSVQGECERQSALRAVSLPHLTHLELQGGDFWGDFEQDMGSGPASLQHLDMKLGAYDWGQLGAWVSRLLQLTHLAVRVDHDILGVENPRDRFPAALASLSALLRLELTEVIDSGGAARAFADAMAPVTQLRHLHLANRRSTFIWRSAVQGVAAVQAWVAALTQLTHLTLRKVLDMALPERHEHSNTPLLPLPLPGSAPHLVHLELAENQVVPACAGELAEALARYTALQYVSLPHMVEDYVLRTGALAKIVRSLAAATQLRHLQLDCKVADSAVWLDVPQQVACLTQLTRLKLAYTGAHAGSKPCPLRYFGCSWDVAPCIAALAHLQHVRLCLGYPTVGHSPDAARRRDDVAGVIAERWPRLTRLTTLDLGGPAGLLGPEVASLLSVCLAPLAPRLVSGNASAFVQQEVPLQAMPGGGERLNLSCVGIMTVWWMLASAQSCLKRCRQGICQCSAPVASQCSHMRRAFHDVCQLGQACVTVRVAQRQAAMSMIRRESCGLRKERCELRKGVVSTLLLACKLLMYCERLAELSRFAEETSTPAQYGASPCMQSARGEHLTTPARALRPSWPGGGP
jgi:hypothetical protein